MKLIAITTLLLVSLLSSSQTTMDTMIFNKINEYRIENCLAPIKMSSKAYMVAENQSHYNTLIKWIYHDQNIKLDSFTTEPVFTKRFNRFGIETNSCTFLVGENLAVIVDSSDICTLSKIADRTLEGWKNSKAHNDLLLTPGLEYGNIAHHIGYEYYIETLDTKTFESEVYDVKGKMYYIAFETYIN